MKIIRKVLFILLMFNLIRIIPGCCDCDEPVTFFSFNKTGITNLDNSGSFPVTIPSDTMPAAAVAFEVSLYDSTGYWYYAALPVKSSAGFSRATAMSCDCAYPVQARAHLTNISITTLFPISDQIAAGAEISGLFAASLRGNYAGDGVYITPEMLCSQTENKIYYDGGIESFGLFLKPEVESPSARFALRFTLSDGSILTDTTALITIRP